MKMDLPTNAIVVDRAVQIDDRHKKYVISRGQMYE